MYTLSTMLFSLPSSQRIYKRMITLHVVVFMSLICSCQCDDRLTPAKPLIFPGGDKLISDGGIFALGFFSLSTNSTPSLFYLGIWYNNIPERTYVWVANRDNPITTPSAKLAATNTCDLVLSDSKGLTLWSTLNNVTIRGRSIGERATAELQNTGNFVLRLPNGTEVWQSFDHPTDTILPGFKLWTNYKKHVAVQIVAWKSPQDPSTGDFSLSGDPGQWGLQIVIWRGTSPSWRSDVWTGATVLDKYICSQVIDNGEEIYHTYITADGLLTHWKLDYTGNLSFRTWNIQSSSWTRSSEHPGHGCLHYGACGPFGYCDITGSFQECKCLVGFEPADGFNMNFSRGCRRKDALKCSGDSSGGEDHFLTLPGMKVPDKFLYIRNMSFQECADECNRNCSCTAYAYANWRTDITTGDLSRCLVWTVELIDTGTAPAGGYGENLYLRLVGSPAALHRKEAVCLQVTSLKSAGTIRCCVVQSSKAHRRFLLHGNSKAKAKPAHHHQPGSNTLNHHPHSTVEIWRKPILTNKHIQWRTGILMDQGLKKYASSELTEPIHPPKGALPDGKDPMRLRCGGGFSIRQQIRFHPEAAAAAISAESPDKSLGPLTVRVQHCWPRQ